MNRCPHCGAPMPSSGLCKYAGGMLEYTCEFGHWMSSPHDKPLTKCMYVTRPTQGNGSSWARGRPCPGELRRVGAGSKVSQSG